MARYAILGGMYKLDKTIGCGGFAKVKLATHIATGEKVAIKIMDKVLLGDDAPRIKLEIKALQLLCHENICKLYQVLESETDFFLVMEYCSGGELFDHIVEKNRLTESESRMIFRQIVSAVAYLHSLGFAHRDLKPENVLLDKDQNVKLIDFGLCARPEGGIESILKTSCGSPTYAAPELVMGRTYLGPEVDVWAMGVLLYTLLAGSLPFHDTNIDCLYKKILSGEYNRPSFMSASSLSLIDSMLQTDPKKRITVQELLSHQWLTIGVFEPVQCKSEGLQQCDPDIVSIMAQHYCATPGTNYSATPDTMWAYLQKWRYDYYTATYLILLTRKKNGGCLKLTPLVKRYPIKCNMDGTPIKSPAVRSSLEVTSNRLTSKSRGATPKLKTPRHEMFHTPSSHDENMSPLTAHMEGVVSPSQFMEPKRPQRKPAKRFRSPTTEGDGSPVPVKKPATGISPAFRTPKRKRSGSSSDTPASAKRVLGSIERSFHKVKQVLAPWGNSSSGSCNPVTLTSKELCNVSTTQCSDPEYVICELSKGLEKRGIQCDRKGFRLLGKLDPNVHDRFGGCSFELEVCYLPNLGQNLNVGMTPTKSILKNGPMNVGTPNQKPSNHQIEGKKETKSGSNTHSSNALVGVRRKRLKGDSWCYKKVCEEVLALTSTELKQKVAESSV